MKNVKMLGLLTITAAALMAFADTALATTLTSPSGTVYTGEIKAETEGHAILHNAFTTVECNSELQGKVESHGSGITIGGKITLLKFTNCTGSNTVTVKVFGSWNLHWLSLFKLKVTLGGGMSLEVHNHTFGGTCIYTVNESDLGSLTGSGETGSSATFDINGTIPRTGGTLGAFCGSSGTLTGSYKVSSPATLNGDA